MWRRIGCVVLIVIALGLVGLIAWKQTHGGGGFKVSVGKGKKKKGGKDDEGPLFEAARKGDLTITVEATGNTEPISDIEVKSEATGRIVELFVKEGAHLKKGDMIARLDQSNQQLVVKQQRIAVNASLVAYNQARNGSSITQKSGLESGVQTAQAGVSSAQSSLDNAQQNLDKAQDDYGRMADLHEKGYATDLELSNAQQELDGAKAGVKAAQSALSQAKSQLENAKTQAKEFNKGTDKNTIEQARLQYEQAKVQLEEAEKQLGDSVIKSPIDGIVLEKPVDVGDSVTSINSAFGGTGTTIVKVADLSRVQVRTSVDEIDIGKIKVGQTAKVVVDAFPNKEFSGHVTNVFPQGVPGGGQGGGLINFIAIVEVDNREGLLLGNMTATVNIVAQTIKDALLIPLSATRRSENDPEATVVQVLKTGEDAEDTKAQTDERKVKLGDTDFKDVVILDGLKDGELVKVRGFDNGIQMGGG
jgi:RND family efflux transporter MFP subunit